MADPGPDKGDPCLAGLRKKASPRALESKDQPHWPDAHCAARHRRVHGILQLPRLNSLSCQRAYKPPQTRASIRTSGGACYKEKSRSPANAPTMGGRFVQRRASINGTIDGPCRAALLSAARREVSAVRHATVGTEVYPYSRLVRVPFKVFAEIEDRDPKTASTRVSWRKLRWLFPDHWSVPSRLALVRLESLQLRRASFVP